MKVPDGVYETIVRVHNGQPELISHERLDQPCADCGFDTLDWFEQGWPDGDQGSEYFMVKPHVWAVADEASHLCIGCLETRLGRQLTPDDFTDAECNQPSFTDTVRLTHRKGLLSSDPPATTPNTATEGAQPRS